jgi:hypothetical protein
MLLMDRRTITHLKENQAALEHKTSRSESSVADTRAWWPRWKTPRTRDRRYAHDFDDVTQNGHRQVRNWPGNRWRLADVCLNSATGDVILVDLQKWPEQRAEAR